LASRVDAAEDVLDRLERLRELAVEVDTTLKVAVDDARSANASWAEIGRRLGTSKQAAAKRFSARAPSVSGPAHTTEASPTGTTRKGWDVTTRGGWTLLRLRPATSRSQQQ
jgi:hypothetical protein